MSSWSTDIDVPTAMCGQKKKKNRGWGCHETRPSRTHHHECYIFRIAPICALSSRMSHIYQTQFFTSFWNRATRQNFLETKLNWLLEFMRGHTTRVDERCV